MSDTQPGWELYRSFLAVVRDGSLSGAARALALTQPTVGRHIGALEKALGIALFIRSQNGLLPTPGALALVPHAQVMATAAEALIREATGAAEEPRGAVRLTASEIVGAEVLPPILTAFRAQYPHIVFELGLSNVTEDLLRRDADIAVRMTRPTQSALVARRIGTVPIGLYAHRSYAEKHGLPRTGEELVRHATIGFDRDDSGARGLTIGDVPITREFFAFRCDSDLGQLAAVRAGLGIGVCQIGIARRDPDLLAVMADQVRFELEMWLVMHEDQRMSRRVRLLFDHLAEALGKYVTNG